MHQFAIGLHTCFVLPLDLVLETALVLQHEELRKLHTASLAAAWVLWWGGTWDARANNLVALIFRAV